jgi:hypothetical protein
MSWWFAILELMLVELKSVNGWSFTVIRVGHLHAAVSGPSVLVSTLHNLPQRLFLPSTQPSTSADILWRFPESCTILWLLVLSAVLCHGRTHPYGLKSLRTVNPFSG